MLSQGDHAEIPIDQTIIFISNETKSLHFKELLVSRILFLFISFWGLHSTNFKAVIFFYFTLEEEKNHTESHKIKFNMKQWLIPNLALYRGKLCSEITAASCDFEPEQQLFSAVCWETSPEFVGWFTVLKGNGLCHFCEVQRTVREGGSRKTGTKISTCALTCLSVIQRMLIICIAAIFRIFVFLPLLGWSSSLCKCVLGLKGERRKSRGSHTGQSLTKVLPKVSMKYYLSQAAVQYLMMCVRHCFPASLLDCTVHSPQLTSLH